MNFTAGKLTDIITIGADVTIPTVAWGTWTGEVMATREAGPLAPEGEFFVTLKDADGTTQEVRTSRLYTGYLNTPAATDDEMIEAIAASDDFTVVTDGAQLAELMGMDDAAHRAADAEVKMSDDIATARQAILDRIARYLPWGGMRNVTVAQVWNWWEIEDMGPVPVERAIRGLIDDGTVEETRHLGALAFDVRP